MVRKKKRDKKTISDKCEATYVLHLNIMTVAGFVSLLNLVFEWAALLSRYSAAIFLVFLLLILYEKLLANIRLGRCHEIGEEDIYCLDDRQWRKLLYLAKIENRNLSLVYTKTLEDLNKDCDG